MAAEVTIRFLVELDDVNEGFGAEEFADSILWTFGDVVKDVEAVDIEEV